MNYPAIGLSEKGAFDDLPEDDLADAISAPKDVAKIANLPAPVMFEENCPKCRGSGNFISYSGRVMGRCFHCKGKGKLAFKTSREDRQRAKSGAAASKARKGAANLEAFKVSHPEVFAWFDGSTFDFAVQMRAAVEKYGHLTDNQLAASLRCVEKLAAKKAEAAARVDNAKAIDTTLIEAAFAKASAILKAPKLRVAGMTISHAKATSANAGALYVKASGTYLGKIMGGKFIRSRECDDAQEAAVLDVAHDPKEAAIRYGRVTGCCACCGRPLENKESIERGIGPICAEKFGWGG
jgi:hypothetical protein